MINAMLVAAANANPRIVSVIDINRWVSPGGRFVSTIHGVVVREPDGVHFTVQGGIFLQGHVLPELHRLGLAWRARHPAVAAPSAPR